MDINQEKSDFPFLQGGGELGKLTRNHDWSQTSIGSPEQWPQSLRTTVSIILNSRFPMFLWWGSELIQFYNDAYRLSLGNQGKHPGALGQKGKECWPEIWPLIHPLIDSVMSGGEATWSEDQLVPIYRNGKLEDVYWTFSYSPVKDESGKIGGVLVVCTETTGHMLSRKRQEERETALHIMIMQAPVAMCVFKGPQFIIETANNSMFTFWGKPEAEVINKPLFDALPEAKDQGYEDLLTNVLNTGIPYMAIEMKVKLPRNGGVQDVIINFTYQPLIEPEGKVWGILAIAADVTEQVHAREKLKESARFKSMIEHATVAIGLTRGREMVLESINAPMLQLIDKKPPVIGSPLLQVLPELKGQRVLDILYNVYDNLEPFKGVIIPTRLLIKGKLQQRYHNISYIPLVEEGMETGVLHIAIDVTEQVEAARKIEESEKKFRSLIEEAPVASCLFVGKDQVIEIANETMLSYWGKGAAVIGKPLKEALPELVGQPFLQILDDVLTTGKTFKAWGTPVELVLNGVLGTYYFDFTYKAVRNAAGEIYGVMDTAVDVTDKVLAQKKTEESEANLRNTILQAPVAMCILRGPDAVIEIANSRMIQMWGKPENEVIGKSLFEGLPEVKDVGLQTLLANVRSTGETFRAYSAPFKLKRKGGIETVYVDFVYEAYRENDGIISGVIVVATDVTVQVIAARKIEISEARFRLLADAMPQMIWTGNAKGELNYYNRAVFDYSGLSYEQIQKHGWLQIVHPDDKKENVEKWIQAIQSGEDFILQHRFRNRAGEYRWQLSRAVPQRDSDGHINLWIGTSTDIHEQKLFEAELDHKVKERTAALEAMNNELQRSNANLEEFAHAASHDLKEPIRKINIFSAQLKRKLYDKLGKEDESIFDRMERAGQRMNALIEDLLLYSHVSDRPHEKEAVDLNKKLQNVLEDLDLDIHEKGAVIETGTLPIVKGYRRQLQQLFQNLVSNSLKYSRAGVAPHITITSHIVSGGEAGLPAENEYHLVEVVDNGIGFEPDYSDKIFQMFQRLHGQNEYEGTGIGLSIVKKVVENHNGKIVAEGKPGEGATFKIYLPANPT